jgi:Mg/Co/Ni transporter MgtE
MDLIKQEKQLKKELLEFQKELMVASTEVINTINFSQNLSEEDKSYLIESIKAMKEIEEVKGDLRIEYIRSLPSYQDYKLFLQSEKIKRIPSKEMHQHNNDEESSVVEDSQTEIKQIENRITNLSKS